MTLIVVMLALTAFSQFSMIPRWRLHREQNGGRVNRGDRSPAALTFERLHGLSEGTEGVVLLGGVIVAVLAGGGAVRHDGGSSATMSVLSRTEWALLHGRVGEGDLLPEVGG